MLKSLLARLSRMHAVRPSGEAFFHKYIAGHDMDGALEEARRLNSEGFVCTINRLGESAISRRRADAVVKEYIRLLDQIGKNKIKTDVSIKLTNIGLLVDEGLCRKNLGKLAAHAGKRSNFLWIDMEEPRFVQKTLGAFGALKRGNVGVAVQAYLPRTDGDVKQLLGRPVRVVKGVYDEPLVLTDRNEVRSRFVDFSKYLLTKGRVAMATHDEEIINELMLHVEKSRARNYEFQMLYGMNTALQRRLRDLGHPVRIYVPYGTEWQGYYMRRLGERLTI